MFKPSISDGRDLIKETMEREWQPALTLCELIQMFPAVLERLLLKVESGEYVLMPLIGAFNLGDYYDIWQWKEDNQNMCITCLE
jgi:hypothetical protein